MAVIGTAPSVSLDHIVVATDFTPASEAALAYAEAFAKRFSSRITIANIVDVSVRTRSEEALDALPMDEMRHESAENLERAVNQVAGDGLRVQGLSLEAHNPAGRTIRLAEEIGADLLVVGTHAPRGLRKFVLGSFAQDVIHHARCAVVTIGPSVKGLHGKALNFNTVLFATDGHPQTSETAAVALAFAEDSLARMVLCHVVDHPSANLTDALDQQFQAEAALRKLIPNAAYDWCEPGFEVEYGDPAQRILMLAERMAADLIVLGAHRSASWFSHFLRGTACKVIEHARCPVMTICTD